MSMKKLGLSLSVLTVASVGVGLGSHSVHADEAKTEPAVRAEKQATGNEQTTQKKVDQKQQEVNDQQKQVDKQTTVVNEAKAQSNQANQAVTDQTKVVDQKQQDVKEKQATVEQAKQEVAKAQEVVKEATPQAIEQAKNQVTNDNKIVSDTQQAVSNAQDQVNAQEKVVSEKAQATKTAEEQNQKDKEAVATAQKTLEDTQALANNAQAEKTKLEGEQATQEKNLETAKTEEATAKAQVDQNQALVSNAEQAVKDQEANVSKAKEDTLAKQNDVTTKENELTAKTEAVKEANNQLAQAQDNLQIYRPINLPADFTPDYYDKLNADQIKSMETEGIKLNPSLPMNNTEKELDSVMIDISNPTDEQKWQMSNYVVGLLNEVREKFGISPIRVSEQSIKFAWDVAKYDDSTINNGHDVNAINQAAKENGFKEYPGINSYENLSIGYVNISNNQITLYDFQDAARRTIVNMLMNDSASGYLHLESLLSNGNGKSMYPIIENIGVSVSGEANAVRVPGKIHLICYNKNDLVNTANYQEGTVPNFPSKSQLEQIVTEKQTSVTNATNAENQAKQAVDEANQAFDEAKTAQKNAETLLATKQDDVKKAQSLYAVSNTNYQSKIDATKTIQSNLDDVKTQLATVQALIANRAAVLNQLAANVNTAQQTEQASEKVLAQKQADQQKEEQTLATLQETLKQAQSNAIKAQNALKASEAALQRLGNAQPNYEKAQANLAEAEQAVTDAQQAYQLAVDQLGALQKEQTDKKDLYEQAKTKLDEEQTQLKQVTQQLSTLKERLATEQRQEALQQQVKEAEQNMASSSDSVRPVSYTSGSQSISPVMNSRSSYGRQSNIDSTVGTPTSLTTNRSTSKEPMQMSKQSLSQNVSSLPKTNEKKSGFPLLAGEIMTLFGLAGLMRKKYKHSR
jgi:SEC10/PgrA surface exclusion-like protein